jgi:hypothetical protein
MFVDLEWLPRAPQDSATACAPCKANSHETETDFESSFDRDHQPNVTEAVPLFDIMCRCGIGDRELINLENIHHNIADSLHSFSSGH